MTKKIEEKVKVKTVKEKHKIPYCEVILRNMLSDERGASFNYDNKHYEIIAGEPIELPKKVSDHLGSLMIRKSRFEHPKDGGSVKVFYEEPRFLIQVLKEFDKEEDVKVRKVIE